MEKNQELKKFNVFSQECRFELFKEGMSFLDLSYDKSLVYLSSMLQMLSLNFFQVHRPLRQEVSNNIEQRAGGHRLDTCRSPKIDLASLARGQWQIEQQWYKLRKFKQAHYMMHWPCICGIARPAEGYRNGDQHHPMNP